MKRFINVKEVGVLYLLCIALGMIPLFAVLMICSSICLCNDPQPQSKIIPSLKMLTMVNKNTISYPLFVHAMRKDTYGWCCIT